MASLLRAMSKGARQTRQNESPQLTLIDTGLVAPALQISCDVLRGLGGIVRPCSQSTAAAAGIGATASAGAISGGGDLGGGGVGDDTAGTAGGARLEQAVPLFSSNADFVFASEHPVRVVLATRHAAAGAHAPGV